MVLIVKCVVEEKMGASEFKHHNRLVCTRQFMHTENTDIHFIGTPDPYR